MKGFIGVSSSQRDFCLYVLAGQFGFVLHTRLNKVLFTDPYTWQNFCLKLLCLVNNWVETIYKTQNSKTKALPCVTVSEYYFIHSFNGFNI